MECNEFYLINAFIGEHARGNPACVIMMDDLKDTNRLQQLAADFNLPATVFLKANAKGFDVRWFAPETEIGLCGHGTLAATWLMTQHLKTHSDIVFKYKRGELIGSKAGKQVEITGDAIPAVEAMIPNHVRKGFHGHATAYFHSESKDIVMIDSEESVRTMEPDWEALRTSDTFGYVITTKGSKGFDMVSRVILPYVSFLEDPATGSAHMQLTPFWAGRLKKNKLHAFQASARGGEMQCELHGEQVLLRAAAEVYAHGKLIG